jgi:drug/metabolite transporter (DMT)-like permease
VVDLDEEKQVSADNGDDDGEDDGEDAAFLKSTEKVMNRIGSFKTRFMKMDLRTFYGYVMAELPTEGWYCFAFLALFYVLINNTVSADLDIVRFYYASDSNSLQVFLLYKLSDPGTIQLIKSGTTLITAVVSMAFLGTKVTRGQWIAIALQVCGIVVTQYKPTGATYSLSTYLVLLFQTSVSAVASVYNQKLCKSVDASMHVMNMSLYSSGAVINLVLHVITRFLNPDEPGFFTGYGNMGAIMVIMSNVFIGLVMTAVYKCKSKNSLGVLLC